MNPSLALLTSLVLVGANASSLAQPMEQTEDPRSARHVDEGAPGDEQAHSPGSGLLNAVVDRINAPYLTEDERDDLAIEHGIWNEKTKLTPARRARIALTLGEFDHPALDDPDAPTLDRARGALMRGQPHDAIALLTSDEYEPDPRTRLRAHVILAQSRVMSGDAPGAVSELEQIETILADQVIDDATELAFGVRGLMMLYTLRPIDDDASVVYRQLNTLIAQGRDTLDQLNTEIRMVEAELLYEHHNRRDARLAALEVIRRNPKHARASAMIGNLAVDAFLFDEAEQIADRIDALAAEGKDNPMPTVFAAKIRARIALRRRDPIGAEQALDPVLSRLPEQRGLLALEAAAAAAGFRSSSTERLLASYNQLSEDQPEALLEVGKTLAEARQYDEAQSILERAIAKRPHWGEPRLQLGLMLVQSGDDPGAHDALEDAIALDPFNLRAQNSLKLVTELMGYERIESEHFVIRYKTGIDSILAKEMVPELERIYERVTGDAPGASAHEPERKTRIELMPNHEWFAVRIGGMPSIHTMAASTGPIIAMESPRDGIKMSVGPYDWARVLQHEFTHTANLSRTRNRIIHWMTEANAVYNEDAPRDARQWGMLLRAYEQGRLFDLQEINEAFVRPKREGDRSLAYAQGAWMFEFIIERFGPDAPLAIMDASAAGRSPTEAFTETLGIGLDPFMDAFMDWAHDQLVSFGLLLDEDGAYPPIEDLLVTPLGERMLINPNTIRILVEQHPDHPQVQYLQISSLLAAGPVRLEPGVVEMVTRYARSNPTEEKPHRLLARHYLGSDNADEKRNAIEHLEYLDAREIHSSAYANELAMIYASNGMGERAVAKAQLAVRRDPFNAWTREQAARIALIADDLALAAHHIGVLIELEPDRAIHHERLEALRARIKDHP